MHIESCMFSLGSLGGGSASGYPGGSGIMVAQGIMVAHSGYHGGSLRISWWLGYPGG